MDVPCAPILMDLVVDGKRIKALAQPTKQAFLFVLNRETGRSCLADRGTAGSRRATCQVRRRARRSRFRRSRAAFDRQGVTHDDLIDFTPELRAEAIKLVSRYRIGPLFTPPVVSRWEGPLATLILPDNIGGANWPGGSFDPETNYLYIHSHSQIFDLGLVQPPLDRSNMRYVRGTASAPQGSRAQRASTTVLAGAAPQLNVQGLPLVKAPYDRITAFDMNKGEIVWQKVHSSTPDNIRNHPALKGLNLPRLGQPGRTFVGTLVTKTLLVAGDFGFHTNAAGQRGALLRAYDKATGADAGAVQMPAGQTGSPITYMHRDGSTSSSLSAARTTAGSCWRSGWSNKSTGTTGATGATGPRNLHPNHLPWSSERRFLPQPRAAASIAISVQRALANAASLIGRMLRLRTDGDFFGVRLLVD